MSTLTLEVFHKKLQSRPLASDVVKETSLLGVSVSGVRSSVPCTIACEDRWERFGDSVGRLLIMLNKEIKKWFVFLLSPLESHKAR